MSLKEEKLNTQQIILGVDPGTNILGYSIISSDKNTIKILINGIIRLNKTDDHYKRLHIIFDKINKLIITYAPTVLAIEAPFFGKNVQSMLKLGRAQGAAIVAAAHKNLTVMEYSPRRIKQSITGNGNASKDQVAKMLEGILQIEMQSNVYDESDALAVAVCHCYSGKTASKTGKVKSGWKEFLNLHPEKIARNTL